MPEPKPTDVLRMFCDGARVVAAAIADPAVAESWDEPSVLEDQRVSGLAGHLARGGVWVVADYLDAGPPVAPVDLRSAGEYFASLVSDASPDENRAIRDRGAAVASIGRDALLRTLEERLGALEARLQELDLRDLITVAGRRVMHIEDYLKTRIVEQTVHLDDLARSVGRRRWPMPEGADALTLAVGVEIGYRRSGTVAMVRALFRRGFAEPALPVL